jgi:anthranilate phosphoribosyltransferase
MMNEQHSQEFKEIIRAVGRGRKLQRDLTFEEAAQAMRLILGDPAISDAQIGAFLVTMRVKDEDADELRGFLQGVADVLIPLKPDVDGLLDLALPYDGKAKFLQTGVAAAMVVAAAGVPVLLHGADGVPTKNGVGPLNLLRALGYPVDQTPEAIEADLLHSNFGVLNLAHVLPRWTALTPLRHAFGLRTLMNTIEKFFNPAHAPLHISGFYHASYLPRLPQVLPGSRDSWVILGEEGSIDIRPGKKTRIFQAAGDAMQETVINAADYGFSEIVALETPNDPAAHAEVIRRALDGESGAAYEQIQLTAATLLWMVQRVETIPVGLALAEQLLRDGQLRLFLERTPQTL